MCGNTTTSRNGKRGWTWGWGLLDMVLTFQSKIQLIWGSITGIQVVNLNTTPEVERMWRRNTKNLIKSNSYTPATFG
jgi:hypothetical protein